MKTIWNIVAIMAVINLLALGGVAGWLKMTDRLSKDRLAAVGKVFAKTLPEETAEKVAAEAEVKHKEVEKAQAEKMAQPPTSASEKIAEQQLHDDQKLQMMLRREQEIENMRNSVFAQLTKIDEREKKLDMDKKAFAAERKRVTETDGKVQFSLALATLEGQKPKDAKQMLRALMDQKQTDQVVAYLMKMEEGKRSKVMAEFVKDDATMAADLLERLRTRGIVVPAQSPSTQVSANESAGTAAVVGGGGGSGGSGR